MKVLVYEGPKNLHVTEVADFDIKPDEVKIQTLYSGISHGTEMNVYRGIAPFFKAKRDPESRLFVPANKEETWHYPIRSCDPGVWYLGYSNVGRVIEVGASVNDIEVGDLVYSHAPHQSMVVRHHKDVTKLPADLKPEYSVFLTNLMTAFNGVLDTRIKLGDTVVVSGLGVLGQLAIQMAKMSGALQVIGVDVIEKRLQTALQNGADYVFNSSTTEDVAYEIRKLTRMKGADAVIEVSGNQRALNEAIRIVAPDATVTALGWYQGECTQLDLSREFHHNRVTIRSSQTGNVNPGISYLWNNQRKLDTCVQLLSKLKLDNLIRKVAYDDVAKAYRDIDTNPQDIIQIVLTY